MPNNQPSLNQFHQALIKPEERLIPRNGSNTFFNVGDGRVNIFTVRDDPEDYRFDLYTDQGHIYTGPGNFQIWGDVKNIDRPFRNFTVIRNTKLTVNQSLTVRGGAFNVWGEVELMNNSQINTSGGGVTIFHPSSVLIVSDRSNVTADQHSTVRIYGRIDIHVSRVQALLDSPRIHIDSAAVFNVEGIEDLDRTYSLSNYERELRERGYVNVNVQGDRLIGDNRIGHIWRQGNPSQPSHVIGINLQLGQIPLGDFRFPVLGRPKNTTPGMQMISDLTIRRNTTLHITEDYGEYRYMRPELYLGAIANPDDVLKSAECIVQGTIIADGPRSMITLDRKGILRIEERGTVHLRNGAIMRSTHNQETRKREKEIIYCCPPPEGEVNNCMGMCRQPKSEEELYEEYIADVPVLYISGTLVIDDISQIVTFNEGNIVFGPTGKIVILNPETEERRILFSIPNGIKDTHLYRLFEHRIQHVVYHISRNTGIGIDQDFPNITATLGIRVDQLLPRRSKEFAWMMGDRRIEQAVHEGIVVWHNDAFIELYHNISPWMDETINLLNISWLFKAYGSYVKDRLQDVVNRLTYAGFGNILFRFILKDSVKEITLSLDSINMENVMNNPLNQRYVLDTDNSGTLFLRNMISNASVENLVHPRSRSFDVPEEKVVEFILP